MRRLCAEHEELLDDYVSWYIVARAILEGDEEEIEEDVSLKILESYQKASDSLKNFRIRNYQDADAFCIPQFDGFFLKDGTYSDYEYHLFEGMAYAQKEPGWPFLEMYHVVERMHEAFT